jgi:hypothetical protein
MRVSKQAALHAANPLCRQFFLPVGVKEDANTKGDKITLQPSN